MNLLNGSEKTLDLSVDSRGFPNQNGDLPPTMLEKAKRNKWLILTAGFLVVLIIVLIAVLSGGNSDGPQPVPPGPGPGPDPPIPPLDHWNPYDVETIVSEESKIYGVLKLNKDKIPSS